MKWETRNFVGVTLLSVWLFFSRLYIYALVSQPSLKLLKWIIILSCYILVCQSFLALWLQQPESEETLVAAATPIYKNTVVAMFWQLHE